MRELQSVKEPLLLEDQRDSVETNTTKPTSDWNAKRLRAKKLRPRAPALEHTRVVVRRLGRWNPPPGLFDD